MIVASPDPSSLELGDIIIRIQCLELPVVCPARRLACLALDGFSGVTAKFSSYKTSFLIFYFLKLHHNSLIASAKITLPSVKSFSQVIPSVANNTSIANSPSLSLTSTGRPKTSLP